jgi:cytochrome P450
MIPKLSFFDGLIFNALYSIPSYLQGLFTRSRFWVSLVSRLQTDRFAVGFVAGLRRRYRSQYFFTTVGGAPGLIVLDPAGIGHILASSPTKYGDAQSKHRGMSHFQPGAVTVSRGEEWKDRRRFNEGVLSSGQKTHPNADQFTDVIVSSTSAIFDASGSRLKWKHFDQLFLQIASGIILGVSAKEGRPLFDRLTAMMRESNRVFALRQSKHFDPFYRELQSRLSSPPKNCLLWLCKQIPSTEKTLVENQIPHWMFAIRETLALNTARAMATVVAHSPQYDKAVLDLETSSLSYIEACVQEAMRLWPTTPFIAREALGEEVIGGSSILPGTQVLILNTFNHRDRESNAAADAFYPEFWLQGEPNLPFNHLSGGPQVCAGKDLALFIAKTAVATLLRKGRYTLARPRLDPSKPMPAMFNPFRVVLRKQ